MLSLYQDSHSLLTKVVASRSDELVTLECDEYGEPKSHTCIARNKPAKDALRKAAGSSKSC